MRTNRSARRSRAGRGLSVRLIAYLAVLALVVSACTSSTSDTTTTVGSDGETTTSAAMNETTTTGESVAEPETLTVVVSSDVANLDLGKETFFDEAAILSNVYDSLTFVGADGSLQPALATEWSVSEDGLAWTLKLREGVLFHSGQEMTSEDVAYSIERHLNPDFPGNITSAAYGTLESVEIVDDYTIIVHMTKSNAQFMQGTPLFTPVVQKSLAEQYSIEEFGSTAESVMGAGTGPYKVVSWQRDDRLVLEVNENYWNGVPEIENLIFRPVPEGPSRTAALLADEADIIAPLGVEQVAALEGNPDVEARSVAGLVRLRLVMNTKVAPFDSLEVREAVNHAIDVQSIIDNLLLGYAKPIALYGVPIEAGFNETLEPYTYDPQLSRDLLADAGYPDGFEVDFPVRANSPKAEEVGQAISGMLAEVGITANVIVLPSNDFQELMVSKELVFGMTTHNGGGQFHIQFGMNVIFNCAATAAHAQFYCNPEQTAKIDEANALALTDTEASLQAYKDAEAMCWEDACHGPLYALETLYGVNVDLNWEPAASGSLSMAEASFGG
jgi:peptide/nickel transport system substrate-binding protein